MLAKDFRQFVDRKVFPCVAAHAASALGQIESVEGGNITEDTRDETVLAALYRFIAEFERAPTLYRSFVVLFDGALSLGEEEFEQVMWRRLQAWHLLDRAKHAWAPDVSSDPTSPNFGFSLGGHAFYVIGLHPNSSRPARRFHRPALVLNLHAQFEALRASGKYQPMREIIRKRDQAFSGSVNPMLADFGTVSEARQYSGRAVSEEWKCPFHNLNK